MANDNVTRILLYKCCWNSYKFSFVFSLYSVRACLLQRINVQPQVSCIYLGCSDGNKGRIFLHSMTGSIFHGLAKRFIEISSLLQILLQFPSLSVSSLLELKASSLSLTSFLSPPSPFSVPVPPSPCICLSMDKTSWWRETETERLSNVTNIKDWFSVS